MWRFNGAKLTGLEENIVEIKHFRERKFAGTREDTVPET